VSCIIKMELKSKDGGLMEEYHDYWEDEDETEKCCDQQSNSWFYWIGKLEHLQIQQIMLKKRMTRNSGDKGERIVTRRKIFSSFLKTTLFI